MLLPVLLVFVVAGVSAHHGVEHTGKAYEYVKFSKRRHSSTSCSLYAEGWTGPGNCGRTCNEIGNTCIHFFELDGQCAVCATAAVSGMTSTSTSLAASDYIYEKTDIVDECENSPCQNEGTCLDHEDGATCLCTNDYHGDTCSDVFPDCADLYLAGITTSGVYSIKPTAYAGSPFEVYCDMDNRGGGWTLFHKRYDGSENFNRGWADHKNGFGSKSAEHWLGLEFVHYLTERDSRAVTFRVDLVDFSLATAWEEYLNFNIASEATHFQLTFSTSGFTGTAGDSLYYHYGRYFQTYDHDPYGGTNYPSNYGGAWWYLTSHQCALNNPYYDFAKVLHGAMVWRGFHHDIALKAAEMKLRYSDFCNDSGSC